MAVDDDGGKPLKYPKSVFFIVSNEFCERFSYYGMRTALSLYFVDILLYSENTATVMYHTFTMFAYFFPLLGAMVADSWLGKYRTILYLSIVYALGQLLLSGSSAPPLHLPVREMSILGLLLIALGTGGIKPCVAAFGGDQFKLPQQEAFLSTFFSLFYFSINAGSLLSTFITPILRKDITCFGQNTCYPLAFLVPSILMVVSIVIFFSGKRMYKVKAPEGNVVFDVTKCICHAIGQKIKSKEKREHWLDYADDQYERRMIEDIKSVLKVLKLFIPLPIFWALFDQQGSRWTFQASRMDGEVFGYLIKPDQFQVINPLFIVLMIPLFQFCIYPIIEKFLFINTPLKKISVGGLLTALSFVISGFVELYLEPTYVVQPSSGLAQVRIFNTLNCNATLAIGEQKYILEGLDMYQNISIPANGATPLTFSAEYTDCKYLNKPSFTITGELQAQESKALSWVLTKKGLSEAFSEKIEKSKTGDPAVRALFYMEGDVPAISHLKLDSGSEKIYTLNITDRLNFTKFIEVNDNSYTVSLDGKVIAKNMHVKFGGVYTIVGYVSDDTRLMRLVTVADPNSVHIFWLLPQYIVITMGEIMYSITGLEFAFTQAPVTMKSLLQASWLLTVAFGNLIVVIIAEAHFFDRQVFEFFLFAVLMFIDIIIFAVMAKFYKYVAPTSTENSEADEIKLQTKQGVNNEMFSEDL